ncbi:MAG: phage tail protein, partial [Ignavibacteria bacterium]|nr:phage tail protein [Ignavibacteria bacterium]
MATVPLSGTDIRLLSGIPFSNDYKHTRWFDDKTSQTNYFLSKNVIHSIGEANFQRIDGHTFIRVNKSIDELWTTNYLMFRNTSYNSKWFYAFVTKLHYVNAKTTDVHFQIDVFQTWKFEMNFKPSFVVREHCPLWDANSMPIVNTVDEGLNYGTEYNIVSIENYRPCDDIYFLVVVAKQGMHDPINKSYHSTIDGFPQIMSYYVHPFRLNGSSVNTNFGLTSSLMDVLRNMYTDLDAVNNVVSMYITDVLPNNPTYTNNLLSFDSNNYEMVTLSGTGTTTIFVDRMDYGNWTYVAGNKYDNYSLVDESKLLMYPYTVLELVDFRGNKVEYKNEYINQDNLLITISASLGMNNKVVYSIKDYLMPMIPDDGLKIKASLEHALINNEPNDLPVLTDMLSAYLQGNRNSIQNQKTSIVWNGAMGAVSNVVSGVFSGITGNSAGVASAGINTMTGLGNTVLEMQQIQAKQKDIQNTPPALTKMGSNTYFDYGNGYSGVWIIKKEITDEYRKKLSEFFNMFGYKLNEVKLPNF